MLNQTASAEMPTNAEADSFLRAQSNSCDSPYRKKRGNAKLKNYCEKKALAVQFKNDPAKMTTEMFWTAIKGKLTAAELAAIHKQITDIETYRKVVLNPLSHEHPTTLTNAEIQGAIAAIDELDKVLK